MRPGALTWIVAALVTVALGPRAPAQGPTPSPSNTPTPSLSPSPVPCPRGATCDCPQVATCGDRFGSAWNYPIEQVPCSGLGYATGHWIEVSAPPHSTVTVSIEEPEQEGEKLRHGIAMAFYNACGDPEPASCAFGEGRASLAWENPTASNVPFWVLINYAIDLYAVAGSILCEGLATPVPTPSESPSPSVTESPTPPRTQPPTPSPSDSPTPSPTRSLTPSPTETLSPTTSPIPNELGSSCEYPRLVSPEDQVALSLFSTSKGGACPIDEPAGGQWLAVTVPARSMVTVQAGESDTGGQYHSLALEFYDQCPPHAPTACAISQGSVALPRVNDSDLPITFLVLINYQAGIREGNVYVWGEPLLTPTGPPTESPTPLPSESPTAAPPESPTPSPTGSPTPVATESPTPSPELPTPSPSDTPTLTPSLSPTPTLTPSPEPTLTPSLTPTETVTPSPTPTGEPTHTPCPTNTPLATPTSYECPTPWPTPTPELCAFQIAVDGPVWQDPKEYSIINVIAGSSVVLRLTGNAEEMWGANCAWVISTVDFLGGREEVLLTRSGPVREVPYTFASDLAGKYVLVHFFAFWESCDCVCEGYWPDHGTREFHVLPSGLTPVPTATPCLPVSQSMFYLLCDRIDIPTNDNFDEWSGLGTPIPDCLHEGIVANDPDLAQARLFLQNPCESESGVIQPMRIPPYVRVWQSDGAGGFTEVTVDTPIAVTVNPTAPWSLDLWIEGTGSWSKELDPDADDLCFDYCYRYQDCQGWQTTAICFYAYQQIDIDVDSDNGGVIDGTYLEDAMEDQVGQPGKVFAVNSDDDDQDGIPDSLDGFDLDGQPGTPDDTNDAEDDLIPLVFRLPEPLDPHSCSVTVRVAYDGPRSLEDSYHASQGTLRLWTTAAASRDKRPLNEGGNFIPPYSPIPLGPACEFDRHFEYRPDCAPPDWFGFCLTAEAREVTLYVEGLASVPGSAAALITFEVAPDIEGYRYILSDTVRVRPIDVRMLLAVESIAPAADEPDPAFDVIVVGQVYSSTAPDSAGVANVNVRAAFSPDMAEGSPSSLTAPNGSQVLCVGSELDSPHPDQVQRDRENPDFYGVTLRLAQQLSTDCDSVILQLKTRFINGGVAADGTYMETTGSSLEFVNSRTDRSDRLVLVAPPVGDPGTRREAGMIYISSPLQVPFVLRETAPESGVFSRELERNLPGYAEVILPSVGVSDTIADTVTYRLHDADGEVLETHAMVETSVGGLVFEDAAQRLTLHGLNPGSEGRQSAVVELNDRLTDRRLFIDALLETELDSFILTSVEQPGVHRDPALRQLPGSDPARAATNADGQVFFRVRLVGGAEPLSQGAAHTLSLPPDPDDTRLYVILTEDGIDLFTGLENYDEEALESAIVLAVCENPEKPMQTNDTLPVVESRAGRLSQASAAKGFVFRLAQDHRKTSKFLLDRLLDFEKTSSYTDPFLAYLRLKGVEEDKIRAILFGLTFGLPNGAAAFGRDALDDISFLLDRGPSMLLGPMMPTRSFDGFGWAPRDDISLISIPTRIIDYAIDRSFRQEINRRVFQTIAQVRDGAQLLAAQIQDMKPLLEEGEENLPEILETLYPGYGDTLGGAIAVDVMGWDPNDPETKLLYAYSGTGYLVGTFYSYAAMTATVDAAALLVSGGSSVVSYIPKLNTIGKLPKAWKMMRLAHKGRKTAAEAESFYSLLHVAKKIEDATPGDLARIGKMVDAIPDAEQGKFIELVYRHVDRAQASPLLHADLTQAVANVVNHGTDSTAAAEALHALSRISDPMGRNVRFATAGDLEDTGRAIADLKAIKRSGTDPAPGLDIERDLLGIDPGNAGTRMPGKGFPDDNLVPSLEKIRQLSPEAQEGFLKFAQLAAEEGNDGLVAAGKLLQLSPENASLVFGKARRFSTADAAKGLRNLAEHHDYALAHVVRICQEFDDDVVELGMAHFRSLYPPGTPPGHIPVAMSQDGMLAVPRILRRFKATDELATGNTLIGRMVDIMYSRSGLDINNCLEVFGSVEECAGFRRWVATAGNGDELFKGKYFEALYARDYVGIGNIRELGDVVEGQDAMDIVTTANKYIECKNVAEAPLTAGGELTTDFLDQINKHWLRYSEQDYQYVFSQRFSPEEETTLTQRIVQEFVDRWQQGRQLTVEVRFLDNSSTIPF